MLYFVFVCLPFKLIKESFDSFKNIFLILVPIVSFFEILIKFYNKVNENLLDMKWKLRNNKNASDFAATPFGLVNEEIGKT